MVATHMVKLPFGNQYPSCYISNEGEAENKKGNDNPESQDNNGGKVGTVYFAVAGPNGERSIVKETGLSDRSKNMQEFARLGMEFLLSVLQDDLKKQESKE